MDLRTGKMRAASPDDYITKITAVAPGGDCPLWRPDGESSMLMKSEIPSLPAQGGRETRTYECVYGHREW
jgi:hypothetical protein